MRTIIPGLVSLETGPERIAGLHICIDTGFFGAPEAPCRFHYRVGRLKTIGVPGEYDYRSGYVTRSDGTWYYKREVSHRALSLEFKYVHGERNLLANTACLRIPLRVEDLLPIGAVLTNLIELDLFLEGIVVLRGCAFEYRGETVCIGAPRLNGKTRFLSGMLRRGAAYIAEDNMVIDIFNRTVYPSCPFIKPVRWLGRKERLEIGAARVISEKRPIDRLLLVRNATSHFGGDAGPTLAEHVLLDSMHFASGPFTRVLVHGEGLAPEVLAMMGRISGAGLSYESRIVKDFEYDELLG